MMQVRSLPFRPLQRPTPPPQPPTPPAPPSLAVAAGAVAWGAPAALLGAQLGPRILPDMVQSALPHGLELVHEGWVGLGPALDGLRWISQPAVQAQVGAVALGVGGALLGAGVVYTLYRMSDS